MRILDTPIFNRLWQPIYPIYTPDGAGGWVEIETQTTQGPVTIQVDNFVADLIHGKKVSWVGRKSKPHHQRLMVTMGRAWTQAHGVGGTSSAIRLHHLPYAAMFGSPFDGPMDHVVSIFDNRMRSLRAVNNTINNANGSGTSTGFPGVSWKARDNKWQALAKFHNGRQHSFGYYPPREDDLMVPPEVAIRAVTPVLHYRSRLYADWSMMIFARYLAERAKAGNVAARYMGDRLPASQPSGIIYRHCLFHDIPEPVLIPPAVEFLKRKIIPVAIAGNVSLAISMARQIAIEDAISSARRAVGDNGYFCLADVWCLSGESQEAAL